MVIVKDQSSHLVYSNIMPKITNLCENLNSIGRRGCYMIMEEKTPLSHKVVCFQMLDFGTSKSNSEVSKSNSNILVESYFFLKNYFTSERAVSHNVLYYQQLSIACYRLSFYAKKIFWVITNSVQCLQDQLDNNSSRWSFKSPL